jgi:hypothetical protein
LERQATTSLGMVVPDVTKKARKMGLKITGWRIE